MLAIVLAVNLLSVMSFAEDGCVNRDRTLTAETMSAEIAQVAEEEMTVIREVFASDSVEPLTMDERGNITYLVQSEIIPDAEITISETEDGGTRFFVVEGELENELVFSSDGKIYLDGKEVVFSSEVDDSAGQITPRARWSTYSKDPIKGTAADYNRYGGTETGNIEFQEKIIDTAVSVIKAILKASIPEMSNLTDAMLDAAAAVIKDGALVKGPDSSFITYEIDSYYYKEDVPLEVHIKYVGEYFYTDDYSGPSSTYTYYYANLFS